LTTIAMPRIADLGIGRGLLPLGVLAALAVVAQAVLAPGLAKDLSYVAISIVATAAVFVGTRLNRSEAGRAWMAVGLALALMTLGNLFTTIGRLGPFNPLLELAQLAFFVAYLPLLAAAYRFGRGTRKSDRTVWLDSGIVGLAALPLVWQFVVKPSIVGEVAGAAAMLALTVPIMDIVLVSLAAPLIFLRFARSPSAYLLLAAFAVMGHADTQYALDSLRGTSAGSLTSTTWLVAYLLFAGAALVPSARVLGAVRDPNPGSRDVVRLMVLATALVVSPFVTLVATVRIGSADLVLLAVLSLLLATLVVLRLQRTVGELASVDERFRRFMGHGGLMAMIKDQAGRYIYMNPSAANVRRADASWYGRTDFELFPPITAAERTAADEEVRRSGAVSVDTIELDGRVWHTERFGMPSSRGTRGEVGILGVDITGRVRAEESMRTQGLELARLGSAIANATDAVIVTDDDDRVVYVNPAFERMTGWAANDVRGRRPAEAPYGIAFGRALDQAKDGATGWRGDIIDRRKDGTDLISEATISPIAIDGGSHGYVTIRRDVTRERTALRVAERSARERVLIAETLGSLRAGLAPEETARAVCEQLVKLPEAALATVLTFDAEGIATVLEQIHRAGGGTSRVRLGPERSAYLRERAIAGPWVEHWVPVDSHPYTPMFAELGIMGHAYAPILSDGAPIGLLIIGSDRIDAVDRLAERLPAIVEFAAITGTLLGVAVADRMAVAKLEAEMQSIIEEGAFYPVFQPIIELATGAIRGYEALTRFVDGTAPDVRFEQAHRLGAGLALEGACLKASFAAAEDLPIGSWLNVNVSPQVVLAGLVEDVLPKGSREIVLEITEHEAITDYGSFRAAIDPIRDRVQIAVDDAGAGFASLRHIVELAPAMVKLDRSIIAGIDTDSSREAVVSGMVRFSGAAGLMLLAEGIETQAELATLRHLGVQLGQGYLLGMPARVEPAPVAHRAAVVPRRATPPRGVASVPPRGPLVVGA
jgi:PAS domain S-box-containing protein